jgi:hypothetical protein
MRKEIASNRLLLVDDILTTNVRLDVTVIERFLNGCLESCSAFYITLFHCCCNDGMAEEWNDWLADFGAKGVLERILKHVMNVVFFLNTTGYYVLGELLTQSFPLNSLSLKELNLPRQI